MEIAVIVALLIVFFLCIYVINHTINERFNDLLQRNKLLQDDNTKLAEKYELLMDLTRHEALDSYRKGLQDGILVPDKRSMSAVEQKPIKTIAEYVQDIAESEANLKKAKEEAEELAALWAFNGDIPKEKG